MVARTEDHAGFGNFKERISTEHTRKKVLIQGHGVCMLKLYSAQRPLSLLLSSPLGGRLWSSTSLSNTSFFLDADKVDDDKELRSSLGCLPIIISSVATPKLNSCKCKLTM